MRRLPKRVVTKSSLVAKGLVEQADEHAKFHLSAKPVTFSLSVARGANPFQTGKIARGRWETVSPP